MLSDGVQKLNTNIQLVNGDFYGDLKSCMTGQVESLHATHYHKHDASHWLCQRIWQHSKRRPETNTSVGCPLLHKQEVLSCAIQFDQLLGHPISATFTNCYDGHEGPRVHEGMGVQLWKMYIGELFDKKPPSTRQVPSPLKCIKESKQSMKNTVSDFFCPWSQWNPVRQKFSKFCWRPRWKPGWWVQWRKRFKWFWDWYW